MKYVERAFQARGFVAVVLLAIAALKGPLYGPVVHAQNGLIVGSGNFFSPIVSDLDKAIAFYRDGIGLEVTGAPANADDNAPLRNMFGLPDAKLRWTVGRPPASRAGVEIVEVSKADGKPAQRNMQDSGAFTLVVIVRDLEPVVGRLRAIKAPIVTTGGQPVPVPLGGAAGRGIVVKDPDGHFVELVQMPPAGDAPAEAPPNIAGIRVRLTVDDAGKALRQYQDLGLSGSLNVMYSSSEPLMKLFGMKADAQYRLVTTEIPASGLRLEFIEFKGVERKIVRSNIQDPGSTRMQLQV